ncbi:MAG TPA: acyltransferase [Rhizomicrobium sp.]|nr:acyltransferase [Rhizomicrobium sp.]
MKKHLAILDGLRGIAALWVLVGHSLMLTGWHVPLLVQPDLGVDLFILLSGFLMVFQYEQRRLTENWEKPSTWAAFWTRRYFRIAPLYYLCLFAALVMGPSLFADRNVIDHFIHGDPQEAFRYLDHSPANIAAHATFLFGLVPSYAFRTPLPDWSLGLEMQFYACFPFLVMLARRIGWVRSALGLTAFAALIVGAMTVTGITFPMPSFLPLKLNEFLAGMLIAALLASNKPIPLAWLVAIAVLPLLQIGGPNGPGHLLIRELLTLTMLALVHYRSAPVIRQVAKFLETAPLHWLGELSYGVYLIHLLVLHPVAAWVITHHGQWHAPSRFFLALGIVAPVSYAIAFVTYWLVERPGQALGRNLVRHMANRRASLNTPAEQIGAP